MERAACQDCNSDILAVTTLFNDPTPLEPSQHHYFDANVCQEMTTAYVDRCSFHHGTRVQAGAGVVWLHDRPYEPQQFQLGSQTLQYAEIATVLITLQLAATKQINSLPCLSFSCHLPLWKRNGFLTSAKKSVKHKDLFIACNQLVENHNMQIFWKKVRGHSREPGPDKEFNDLFGGFPCRTRGFGGYTMAYSACFFNH